MNKTVIYRGTVFHKRFKPKLHELSYKVFSVLFDLDELDTLDRENRYFSYNKRNLISFWNKDYGYGDGRPLRPYVEDLIKKGAFTFNAEHIRLLCYPRVFGYVFNPLSVYYCYDENERLGIIIYEVSNTFKQRHSYVIEVDQGTEESQSNPAYIKQSCQKEFYVSPFMEMDQSYHFDMMAPADAIDIQITQKDRQGIILKAFFKGECCAFDDQHIKKLLLTYPLMTLKVVMAIHWEALKLWKKGIRLVKRPQAESFNFTVIKSLKAEKSNETN